MACCDACGSQKVAGLLDDLSYCYKEDGMPIRWQYRLLECRECGLVFVDPKPTWKVLEKFYDQTYGSYTPMVGVEGQSRSPKYWIGSQRYAFVNSRRPLAIIRTAMGMAVEWITGRTVSYSLGIPLQLPKDAKIFEMGYGSGYWLETMSLLGYTNLFGYDIDSNPDNKARLLSAGINISEGVFLENEYPDSTFDCIRLEHVFEHLLNPVEVLTKCRAMLKPGGFLVMNFPGIDAWSRRLSLIHNASINKTPRHLYHHTSRSATIMVQKAGFEVLKVKAFSDMDLLASTLNNMRLARGKTRIPNFLLIPIAPLYKLFGALTRKGDLITIWSQKADKSGNKGLKTK